MSEPASDLSSHRGASQSAAFASVRSSARGETAEEVLAEHIEHTVDLLLECSRVLAERVAAGRLGVVGLSYRLADGSAELVAARGLDTAVPTPS